MFDKSDRLAAARAALDKAENKLGLTSVTTGSMNVSSMNAGLVKMVKTDAVATEIVPTSKLTLGTGEGKISGGVYQRNYSRQLLTDLATGQADGWLAVMAYPHFGWLAARESGINLERCLFITQLGTRTAQVLQLLINCCSVIFTGPLRLNATQRSRLAAAARKENTIIFSTQWAGARQWETDWDWARGDAVAANFVDTSVVAASVVAESRAG